MPDKTLLQNFTPCVDSLVHEPDLGIIGAAIYGQIWRYCQGPKGACFATLVHIGENLGITRKTVHRYVNVLEKKGYIRDVTPADTPARTPRVYEDTGRVSYKVTITAQIDGEDAPAQDSVTQSYTSVTVVPTRIDVNREIPSEHSNRVQTRIPPAPVADAVPEGEGETIPKSPGPPKDAQNRLRSALREHFKRKMGLCPPPVNGQPARWRKEMGVLWWSPLREICALAQWDERRAKKLIDDALTEMDGLTVSDPHSILKVCRAQAGKRVKQDAGLDAEVERIKRRSLEDRLRSEEIERRRREYYAKRQKAAGGS